MMQLRSVRALAFGILLEVFAGGYIFYPDKPPITWYDETLGPGIFYHDRQLNEAFLSVFT